MKISKTNRLKLKIKIVSLADEAKTIRRLEKAPFIIRENHGSNPIREHRVFDVRNESRATHLALGYIDGIPYKTLEKSCKDIGKRDYYILPRVAKIVKNYSKRETGETIDILGWINA